MNSDMTPSPYYPTGYCGDKRFISLVRTGQVTTANSEPAAVLGCAVIDAEGKVYFSPAQAHLTLLSEIGHATGIRPNYDEVEKGFYNSQGVYMSRRQTKAYMIVNDLPLLGTVYDEVYSDNIWAPTTSRQSIQKALTIAPNKRGGTVTEMMERKRQLKRAKQLKRHGGY